VALKADSTAVDAEAAEAGPVEVEDRDLAAKYPVPAPNWRRAWTEGIPLLDDPPEGRKRINTATVIEAQTSKSRRAVRTRGHFPSDEAAAKSIYLAQTATSREWTRLVRQWQAVKSQRAIVFEGRFPMASSKRQRTEFRTVSSIGPAKKRARSRIRQSHSGWEHKATQFPCAGRMASLPSLSSTTHASMMNGQSSPARTTAISF